MRDRATRRRAPTARPATRPTWPRPPACCWRRSARSCTSATACSGPQAWDELRELAELVQAPVMTTMAGKSAFPENHPLSLGAGGHTMTGTAAHFLVKSDLVFGIGCSFAKGSFSVADPDGKKIVQITVDARDARQGLPDRPRGRRRRQAGAAPAHRRGQAATGSGRSGDGVGRPRSRDAKNAYLRRVAAAADRRRDADQPVPGDLGPDAHARSGATRSSPTTRATRATRR